MPSLGFKIIRVQRQKSNIAVGSKRRNQRLRQQAVVGGGFELFPAPLDVFPKEDERVACQKQVL